MNYDIALIDEAVLALLAAFSTDSGNLNIDFFRWPGRCSKRL